MELSQEAIAQSLIGGVASDYQVQPSSSSILTASASNKNEAGYS